MANILKKLRRSEVLTLMLNMATPKLHPSIQIVIDYNYNLYHQVSSKAPEMESDMN